MAVAAADIAPKAFQQLVQEGGGNQDVEDDLQVRRSWLWRCARRKQSWCDIDDFSTTQS